MGDERGVRRPDWLRGFAGVLWFFLVTAGVGTVAAITAVLTGKRLPVAVPINHVWTTGPLTGVMAGTTLDDRGYIDVYVTEPTLGQSALSVATWLPTAAVLLAMLALLLNLVRGVRRSGPFTTLTVRRLRRLGAVVTAGGVLAAPAEFLARFSLVGTVTDAGPAGTLSLTAPLTWLLAGVGYLAIAEIVNRGRDLRQELDEVI